MRSCLPLVSIVIPTYNRSELLQVAVESVLAQTYPHVEVIVVDDGSTDDTGEAVARYGGRVAYLKQTNRDVAAARNTGFCASSGECILMTDAQPVLEMEADGLIRRFYPDRKR